MAVLKLFFVAYFGLAAVALVGLYSHFGVSKGSAILDEKKGIVGGAVFDYVLSPLGYPVMMLGGCALACMTLWLLFYVLIVSAIHVHNYEKPKRA